MASDSPSTIEISLVMTTCSRAPMLRMALDSLAAQTILNRVRVEFVLVDDQSTDNTMQVLEEFQRASRVPVRLMRGPKQGVAAARNLAAQAARGTWLASFDDDEIAPPDWLAQLYDAAVEHNADCVGGSTKLKLPEGRKLEEVNRRARRLLGEVPATGDTRVFTIEDLPATNNVLIRREVFEALRGFDTHFTEGGEDTDLFQRMRDAGYTMWFAPGAQVEHQIPAKRLEPHSIGMTAMRIGTVEAKLQRSRGSYNGLVRNVLGRCGLALLRDVPQLALASLRGDQAGVLDAKLSLRVTQGLLRALPALRGGDSEFLAKMDFRMRHGEREDAASKPATKN